MYPRPETPTSRLRESRRRLLRSSGVFRAIGPISHFPKVHYPREVLPLDATENMVKLEAISEAFAALQKNMDDLETTHKAVTGFNESFASFLYGLMITTFCNNFTGCPTTEKYNAMMQRPSADEQLDELRAKLHAARQKNAQLKEQVSYRASESRQKLNPGNLFMQRPPAKLRVPPPRAFAPLSKQSKIPVARDDSYSTTDTFIEVPGSAPPVSTLNRLGASQASQASTVPNLDQPPRYMRGLFEITGASNIRRNPANRVEKKPSRQFGMNATQRMPYRRADTAAGTQRAASYSSAVSDRNAVSAAAQRAQRARDSRLSSRPPFR